MSGSEQVTDGDVLEAEAGALVKAFNGAAPDYAPELEWFAMGLDHDTGTRRFVFQAPGYIDSDGLQALRDLARTVVYIEAYQYDGEVIAQISVPVHGEIPAVKSTEGERS